MLVECQATYPLQVLRPQSAPSDGSLSLIVLLLSAGLLDGDAVSIDVVVEQGARLALRTQAATQVHAGHSTQQLRVTVATDASFSYLPHAIVPHADADHHVTAVVYLEPGGRAFVAEALSPGRVQYGEEFAYQQVRLDLDVWCANAVIARERALIRPDTSLRRAQFGASTHTAGAYLLGGGWSPVVAPCPGVHAGVSELAHGGWYVRAVASRAADLEAALGRLQSHWSAT